MLGERREKATEMKRDEGTLRVEGEPGILEIKSARIKNASSETSYSRFLPVVGINRPFRRDDALTGDTESSNSQS